MNKGMKTAIVLSASSDIGYSLCQRWVERGWKVLGTYRTASEKVDELLRLNVSLVKCDGRDNDSMNESCSQLESLCGAWDILVACIGDMEPVGLFEEVNFDAWETSFKINFTSQLRFVRKLLSVRCFNSELEPCVLFFAGSGTNNAPKNYSAYTISKISLIKMCEILDAEIPSVRFSIIGPGWVKSKIHQATINAGKELAGDNFQKTLGMLKGEQWVSMEKVLDCCDWIIKMPKDIIGGRNFSVESDAWGQPALEDQLLQDENMYKLRRRGNDWGCGKK